MILPFTDSEVSSLRQEALSVLMASELFASDPPCDVVGPGSVQYLLSLAQVALSASVELPVLWDSSHLAAQLLQRLLRCPQYEVRELAAESILRRLKEEEKGRPMWLDETTLSNLTSLALHEQHPQCLAKVRPHICTQRPYRSYICFLCLLKNFRLFYGRVSDILLYPWRGLPSEPE